MFPLDIILKESDLQGFTLSSRESNGTPRRIFGPVGLPLPGHDKGGSPHRFVIPIVGFACKTEAEVSPRGFSERSAQRVEDAPWRERTAVSNCAPLFSSSVPRPAGIGLNSDSYRNQMRDLSAPKIEDFCRSR
jgi:hypothetical protein